MKNHIAALLFIAACWRLQAQDTAVTVDAPQWLLPLREAVFEQALDADDIRPLYTAAAAEARRLHTGAALHLALSRAEFLMGKALQDQDRNQDARPHYSEGLRLAELALGTAPGSEAWLLRAKNLSQLCSIGPWTFTAANGLNVERYAKNALNFDSRNAAAQYLIAARWVFAPAPFHNHRRGVQMMKDILENGDLAKDDLFNVYSAIGYGYVQQKRLDEARPWILKSLEIYPSNKYAAGLLE